ncbi:hypothetical protein [Mycobacterium haemophilum]|uniref:hypothetical protein n=1 Tax=Mycobacterium haemophilum TaxID=29311 RepID=UPI000AAD1B1E|nr:hypothetical protein [Mycobacterium haemophilum]MCV7340597.1 hypothetical protein [Mycobacterium haemophilum DSM 44634]
MSDVKAHVEAEGVAVEAQGGVRVIVREEARMGICFATHSGIPAIAFSGCRR